MMRSQHVDPEQAVLIHQDIQAKHSLAIHWGTFALANEVSMYPALLHPGSMSNAWQGRDEREGASERERARG